VEALTTFYQQNRRLVLTIFWVAVAVLFIAAIQERLVELRPSRYVQTTITGLLVGGIYALIALGIVVVNKASGVFNFAHGFMMILGGMIFFSFFSVPDVSPVAAALLASGTVVMVLTLGSWQTLRDPRSLALGGAAVVGLTVLMTLPNTEVGNQLPMFIRAIAGTLTGAVFIGLLIERFTIRPLIGQPLFASVLMTLAVAEVLRGVTNLLYGTVAIPLPIFSGLDRIGIPSPIRIEAPDLGGNIIVQTPLLIAFVLALVAFTIFVLFFRYTNVGLAMRASAENQTLAQSIGLRVRIILAVAWGIAAILAGTAGVLQGGATSLDVGNMPLLALRAFPAVLLGGLESISGALVGGLVIGLVQEWANLLFRGTNAGTELAPYVVLMIVLIIRPEGLFGEKRIERI
jgi:branched-chain amino acid transport system permease protein